MPPKPSYGDVDLDDVHKPLRINSAPFYGLVDCRLGVESRQIDLDPDYQRGHVWTDLQAAKFIGHLLEGGAVQPLIVNVTSVRGDDRREMVDGKQRVAAAMRWASNQVPALLSDGRKIYLSDLNKRWRTKCSLSIGLEFGEVRLTRREVLELYIKLNNGGTVHAESEIARVRDLLAQEKA